MDQRRIILFLSLSFAVLVLNAMFMAPPRPPKQLPPPGEKQQAVADPPGEDAGVEAAPVVDADEQAVGELTELPEEQQAELTYLTLGSVGSNSPYRLLYTLTNQGAAVRRVELASHDYRDLQDRGGYLGHLELVPDLAGGLRVQVVGAGTPAALAGVQVGDRIMSVIEKDQTIALETPRQFAELLARRKPRAKFAFTIARGDEGPRQLEATLGWRPLEVLRPESENVLMRTKTLPEGFVNDPSFLFTMQSVGKDKIRPAKDDIPEALEINGVELRETFWEITAHDAESVTFRKLLPQYRLELIKRYKLSPVPEDQHDDKNYPGYGITLDVEIRNLDNKAIDLAYRLDGPNGLPIEGWWYARKFGRHWSAAGLRDVVGRYFGSDAAEQSPTTIANGEGTDFEGGSMAFMGVDAQYFAAALLPVKKSPSEVWLEVIHPVSLSPKPKARSNDGLYANVTCRLISKVNILQAGETLTHTYNIFTGPKRPELLTNYVSPADPKYTLIDLMYYGWFGSVARAMLALLHLFYGWVGNYGIAIIMLTVLVRSLMFPISRKQVQSMAKMQELKPELDKLKEKYKNDAPKQSQAMQELYRKYNINPLAGCLPMFIQLPIFIGLYRALAVDVELRQAPLISDTVRWCSNLAAPDMLLNWSAVMPTFISSGEGFFSLGPYLNVLPLVTVALFLLQQTLFMPEPVNAEAALQQKIMKYMMVFMGLLFYKVAAGLCIYFIASSIWGIAERKLMPSMKPAAIVPSASDSISPHRKKNGATGRDTARSKKKR